MSAFAIIIKSRFHVISDQGFLINEYTDLKFNPDNLS